MCTCSKLKLFNFEKLVATKMENFSPFLFCRCYRIRDPRSGIPDRDGQKSGIRDKHNEPARLIATDLVGFSQLLGCGEDVGQPVQHHVHRLLILGINKSMINLAFLFSFVSSSIYNLHIGERNFFYKFFPPYKGEN